MSCFRVCSCQRTCCQAATERDTQRGEANCRKDGGDVPTDRAGGDGGTRPQLKPLPSQAAGRGSTRRAVGQQSRALPSPRPPAASLARGPCPGRREPRSRTPSRCNLFTARGLMVRHCTGERCSPSAPAQRGRVTVPCHNPPEMASSFNAGTQQR